MSLTYQFMKKRADFGRQPMFCEQGPEMCDSITVNPAEHKHFILRNPVHEANQNTPNFSECYINTIRAEYRDNGANHAEGGWPKDVNVLDPEATQRYRRKIEKEDNYIHCVMSTAPGIDHYVLQNNAIDLYQTYNIELPTMPALERISCRTVNVYRDPCTPNRPVSSICWQPDGGKFVVSYVDVDFNRIPRASIECYIWDIESPLAPELVLEPPFPVLDLQYSPRDTNLIGGAFMNGQVGYWDRRHGATPVALCAAHTAHRDLVRNVLFINTKSGTEFFSGGPDGACKWWDLRHFEEPTDEMIMDAVKSSFDVPSMATSNGISALEYEATIPTRFMVGTENGLVLGGNRKGKTPMEQIPGRYEVHNGPVHSLQRNPYFLKNFLTVGDWTARVWSEDCKESAVIWSPPHRHKITCGIWSPGRMSLMLLAQSNGIIALWDLLRKQHEPVLTMQVCEEPLTKLSIHENATFVACGSKKGNIYMVELSQTLAQSDKNDKVLMTQMFERESKRERILEARMREFRLKLRQAEEGSPAVSTTDLDATIGDKDLSEAATDYLATVKKELAAM